jgi:hypothetical protein
VLARVALLATLLVLLLGACVIDDVDQVEDSDEELVLEDPDPDGKADGPTTLWYTPITREYFLPSVKVATETRKLFKSEAEWVAFFGQPSPGIDFDASWAIFYTPGTQRADLVGSPGWRAKLARVRLSATGQTVSITTRLEMNGDCGWRRTAPFITATIKKPATNPPYQRFYRSDTTRSCN